MTTKAPLPALTPKLKLLLAELLDQASDEFSNHGCNDFNLPDSFTDAEALAFDAAYRTANGDPENAATSAKHARVQSDASLMSFFAEILRGEALLES